MSLFLLTPTATPINLRFRFEKKVGDAVAADEVVMEIETDKTTVGVPSPVHGIIEEIFVTDGDTVKAGQQLFRLKVTDGPPAAAPKAEAPKPAAAAPPPPPPQAPRPAVSYCTSLEKQSLICVIHRPQHLLHQQPLPVHHPLPRNQQHRLKPFLSLPFVTPKPSTPQPSNCRQLTTQRKSPEPAPNSASR